MILSELSLGTTWSGSEGLESLGDELKQTAKGSHACMCGGLAHESEPGGVLVSMSK